MNESAKLTEEKLFECFKSLNVPVQTRELVSPTKDFVVRVFDTFLSDLHIKLSGLSLLPFECVGHLDNPELYEEGQHYIILLVLMNDILRHCRCPVTITLTDIIAPKPKKTKKILNFLVVFWSYILQKQELFLHVYNTIQPEIQKCEEINKECENLDEKYEEYFEKLKVIKTETPKEELLKINAVLEEKMKKFDATKNTMVNEYQQLKEKESHLQTEKVNIDLTIATNKEKLSELDQVILSSPEKIKTGVQKLKDMTKDVEEQILEKEKVKKEKRQENENKKSFEGKLEKSNTKMQNLHSELQTLTESIQALATLNNECLEENKGLQELQSAVEAKESMANFYHDKCDNINSLKKKQIEEISATYEMLQRQLSEEAQCQVNLDTSIDKSQKNIDIEVESIFSIVNCLKTAEAETKEYRSHYKQMMSDIYRKFREDCEEISKVAKKKFKNMK